MVRGHTQEGLFWSYWGTVIVNWLCIEPWGPMNWLGSTGIPVVCGLVHSICFELEGHRYQKACILGKWANLFLWTSVDSGKFECVRRLFGDGEGSVRRYYTPSLPGWGNASVQEEEAGMHTCTSSQWLGSRPFFSYEFSLHDLWSFSQGSRKNHERASFRKLELLKELFHYPRRW